MFLPLKQQLREQNELLDQFLREEKYIPACPSSRSSEIKGVSVVGAVLAIKRAPGRWVAAAVNSRLLSKREFQPRPPGAESILL